MSECTACGAAYEPEDRYCHQCGKRLETSEVMASGAVTEKSLNLVDVHYNLGLVYFKKGQYKQALETWEKALSRDPQNELLQERIAEARTRLEDNP